MKKQLLFCVFLSLLRASYSQFNEVDFIIEPNISNYNVKDVDIHGSGFGFNVRVPMRYKFTEMLSVDMRSGLSFTSARVELNQGHASNHFAYFSVPTYLCLSPIETVSLYAGLEFDYKLNSYISENANIMSGVNQDYSLGVSIGFSYNFLGGLKFNVFYTYGLSSLVKDVQRLDENGDEIGDLRITKNCFAIGLSYKLYRRK